MIRTPHLRRTMLLTVVVGAVLIVSAFLLHRSTEQLRADRALVEQQTSIARQHELLLKNLKDTERERATLQTLRPSADTLAHFVEGLEGAAARAFIEQDIEAIPPQADKSGQPYGLPVVRYRLTLLGTAEKVEAFLRELHRLPEVVRVERAELRAPPDGHVLANARTELIIAITVQSLP